METHKLTEEDIALPRPLASPARCRRRCGALLTLFAMVLLLLVGCYWTVLELGDRFKTSPANQCELVDELTLMRLMNEQERIRVPSDDFRTLVKFVGSIRYLDGQTDRSANSTDPSGSSRQDDNGIDAHQHHAKTSHHHLPLELKSIELVRHNQDGAGDNQALVLKTNCARIVMQLISDARQLIVGSIELETIGQLGNSNHAWRACQIGSTEIKLDEWPRWRYSFANSRRCPAKNQTDSIQLDAHMHHDCKRGFWRDASTFVQRPVARLEIYSFEFELEGQAELIRQNVFSKPRMGCK